MDHILRAVDSLDAVFRQFVDGYDEEWTPEEKMFAIWLLMQRYSGEMMHAQGFSRLPDGVPAHMAPLDDVGEAVPDGEEDDEDEE